jgi:Zn-dependent protease
MADVEQWIFTLPLWLVAFLLSLTCHEAAHALAAKWGGDKTAYLAGQVTLDPIPHIRREPFGTIVMPIVSFLMNGGGWMIGWASAPFDPNWADRYPRRAAWMAAAGPAANFILVLLSGLIIHFGLLLDWFGLPSYPKFDELVVTGAGKQSAFTMFLSVIFSLNLLLGTFNLLPFPPLDGNSIVGLFLSEGLSRRWHAFFRQGSMSLVGLLVAWVAFGKIWSPIFSWAVRTLYFGPFA